MGDRTPTVNDLRVKLCYICREEERAGAATEGPPRQWTHPCNCTLVAHEACLLKWIQSSQSNSARAPNALKCPQCGTQYELESNNPAILRILSRGNKVLQKTGRFFTVITAASAVGAVGTGIYILLTGYGAYAMQQFLGKEMYDLLLTDDPSNWSWPVFLNLPLIPISLIVSRFQRANQMLPIMPLLLLWPSSVPVNSQASLINSQKISILSPSPSSWPPSPALVGLFLIPLVRSIYNQGFTRLSNWVLGTRPTNPAVANNGRFAWNFNEGGPFVIRVRANVNRDEVPPQEEQPGEAPQAPVVQDGEEPPPGANEAVAAAEQVIEINAASLGRLIGGALLIPAISSAMGSLLFRLSLRSHLLRDFLAIRTMRRSMLPQPLGVYSAFTNELDGLGPVQQFFRAFRMAMGVIWKGTRTWSEADPVWWRNSIGLGLFVVAKDCVQLWHLWLVKRELESRRVKNRDFSNVDIRELDLIPGFIKR